MEICGNCLHDKGSHTNHNSHFMYCDNCNSICDIEEYNMKHNPTDISIIMKIASKKQ